MKAKGIFSVEADLVVIRAMNWLEDRKHYRIPAICPYVRPTGKRHFSDQDKAALRDMARHSGWQEVGGMGTGARSAFERSLGVKSQEEMNEAGMGRTHWVGQPEWARGFGMNPAEILAAVDKAIAGERLGSKQREIVQAMLEALYEERAL